MAPSIAYATPGQDFYNQATPGTSYRLGNVSEFPHYGGVFQCKNIVLGTRTVGTIGKQSDALVQVKLLGSFVSVLWPDQSGETVLMSAGGSPGKLTSVYTYGSLVDTAGYDHLALYCYAKKTIPGARDDIILKIERRPLPSVDFAVDQTVEYDVVDYAVLQARYRDQLHVRSIDYSDMTIKEPSFVFDAASLSMLSRLESQRVSETVKRLQTRSSLFMGA